MVHHAATKFEFKSPSVHSVVRGHPTTKSEFRQVQGLTVPNLIPKSKRATPCLVSTANWFLLYYTNLTPSQIYHCSVASTLTCKNMVIEGGSETSSVAQHDSSATSI
ncbi:hypothetical protein E2C01_020233 [Portunus trituberculatus]|uniref:Uncharacterized protein n=1 Tax=Portunus trituberculatus TaxID=210409 RepID=A0A5B7E166_PORTR|nr:hypothetical protein [Portunus trituberculatus]